MRLLSLFLALSVGVALGQRDCFPWPNLSQAACEARGCIYEESPTPGVPWCYFDDSVCPSEIEESSRVDCLPEGGGKDACLVKGCVWCESETPGVPWCFDDPDVNMGGDFCPENFPSEERVDCHPDAGAGRDACIARGCYWCSDVPAGGPYCFVPKEHGYRMVGDPVVTPKGYQVMLERVNYPSWFGVDIKQVQVDVEFQADERLRIKFSDANADRWEVPLDIESPDVAAPDPLYDVVFETSPVFGIKVVRRSTGAVIFDTTMGGLYLSDQFLQFSARLNSANVYGFGEHEHHSFRHDMNFVTWPMWSRDKGVSTLVNLYGHQPVYMNVEESFDAHMVLILNSNAADVTLMPAPGLTYRSIGGVLDLYFFLGPAPEKAVQQYLGAVGHPIMVPYWALGFQLCRFGYKTIGDMQEAVDRMRHYDIPHDIQYGDIDYMLEYRDFTIDPVNFAGLPEYVQKLKTEGTRYVIILDPAIWNGGAPGEYPPFDRGTAMDVWIKDSVGEYQEGVVWPGPVFFPDYTNPATEIWWGDESVSFKQQLDFSGLWIDMNEPASFGIPVPCANNSLNYPMFIPRIDGNLLTMTICMDNQQYLGRHYDVHSLYGWSMAKQTLPVARRVENNEKRGIVFSRSTFPGAGSWGQHWLGDNEANWAHLRWSIIGLMEFNMFGFPYVGADICGFFGEPSPEMCQRWQQLGAFYTFSRNHNGENYAPQDPGYFGDEVARVTRETLHIRYTLLPYLYTLMYRAHTNGTTVIKPLMFEFRNDATALGIHDQFMWGPAFLISPVLDEAKLSVQAYFPEAKWYSYYDGADVGVSGGSTILDAPLDFIPLHVRGNYILPTQQPGNSTMWSRSHPMGLIIALDDRGEAHGSLFWDDGEELDSHLSGHYYEENYWCGSGLMLNEVVHNGYPEAASLEVDDIRIFGDTRIITSVQINDEAHSDWDQDSTTLAVTIRNANIPFTSEYTVQWS